MKCLAVFLLENSLGDEQEGRWKIAWYAKSVSLQRIITLESVTTACRKAEH